jgi:hypothetical protein
MAKLPDNFVQSPPATSRLTTTKPTAGKLGRRPRKPDVELDAEAAAHVHSVLVRLSADEHSALSAACEALVAVGHAVSIEDMIRQVIARWIAATRAMQAASVPVTTAPAHQLPASQLPASAAPAITSIRAQLRRLAGEPVRRWQELRRSLRRWSHVFDARTRP